MQLVHCTEVLSLARVVESGKPNMGVEIRIVPLLDVQGGCPIWKNGCLFLDMHRALQNCHTG